MKTKRSWGWGALVILVCSGLSIGYTTRLAMAASPIDNLKPGEWYEVPNSKIRAVLPNPIPPGNGPATIVTAWNGGAYDTRRDNFIIWGGGHGDYAGNEMYTFNLNTLQWSRVWGPSALAAMTPAGSSTCPDTYQDGMPAARHTYGGLEYLPNIDKFFSMGGSLWCGSGSPTNSVWTFDFTAQSWLKKGAITPIAGRYGGLELGVNSAYDPNTGHLFATSPTTELLEYDPLTDIWKMRGSVAAKYSMTSAIDSRRKYMTSIGNTSPYGAADAPGTIYRYNLASTGTITQEKIISTGAIDILNAPAPAFQYDPVTDQFVAWKGGSDIYTLDPATFVWTRRPAAATNTVTPTQPTDWGTFGRFRYIPSKNAFIVVNSIDENVYIYKLSAEAGTTNVQPPVVTPPVATPDTTPPTVTITSPAPNATISGSVVVSADAADASGIASVQFNVDGSPISGQITTTPYSMSFNTTTFSSGAHSLTAVAYDKVGNQRTSAAVAVTVSNGTPNSKSTSGTVSSTVPVAPSATTTVTQIDIPSGVFVALDRPDRGKGVAGTTKHTTWAHNPIDGRMYQVGGDFAGSVGQSSYHQDMFSFSVAERFADKANKNAGWRMEHPYCSTGGVQPKSPDFVGWTWDSKRKVFWFVPGLSVVPGSVYCDGETATHNDDYQYLFNHLMTFNPFEPDIAKRWTDYDANPGPNYYDTWQSDYDPQTDSLIRFSSAGCCGAVVEIYDIQAKKWTEYGLGMNALNKDIRIWAEGHAPDIPGRAIYTIDGQAGRIFRYNIDQHNMTDLGPIPGGKLNVGGSNDAYLAWDPIHKIVFFFRVDTSTLHIYHPDTKLWESPADVTSPAGLIPHTRHGMAFDPYQNVLILFGSNDVYQVDNNNPDPNMYLYRYTPGGSPQYTVTSGSPGIAGSTSGSVAGSTTGSTSSAGSNPSMTSNTRDQKSATTPTSSISSSGGQISTPTAPSGPQSSVQSPQTQNGTSQQTTPASQKSSEQLPTVPSSGGGAPSPINPTTYGNAGAPATETKRETRKLFEKSLYPGVADKEVVLLQQTLIQRGYLPTGSDNGYFGPLTQDAVRKFQCAQGVVCGGDPRETGYGLVGAATRSKLNEILATASVVPASTATTMTGTSVAPATPAQATNAFTRPLYLGVKSAEVAALQKILVSLGYLAVGKTTGYFGPLTQDAVRKFQCAQGVVCGGDPRETGYGLVGTMTRKKLNEIGQ